MVFDAVGARSSKQGQIGEKDHRGHGRSFRERVKTDAGAETLRLGSRRWLCAEAAKMRREQRSAGRAEGQVSEGPGRSTTRIRWAPRAGVRSLEGVLWGRLAARTRIQGGGCRYGDLARELRGQAVSAVALPRPPRGRKRGPVRSWCRHSDARGRIWRRRPSPSRLKPSRKAATVDLLHRSAASERLAPIDCDGLLKIRCSS